MVFRWTRTHSQVAQGDGGGFLASNGRLVGVVIVKNRQKYLR